MRRDRSSCQVMITCCFLLYILLGANTSNRVIAASTVQAITMSSAAVSSAVILNSGSTNTCSYHIEVQKDGRVHYSVCTRSKSARLPHYLAGQFFTDLNAAVPLDNLPFVRCQKSASFGSRTMILYAGRTSPDLLCPSLDVRVFHLNDDVTTILLSLSLCLAKYSTCV